MVLRPSAGAPRAPAGAVPVADRLDQLADSVQVLSRLSATWVLISCWWMLMLCLVLADLFPGTSCELVL
jgi:hypothetical protein